MNLQDKACEDLGEALNKFKNGKIDTSQFMAYIAAANTVQKQIASQIHTATLYEKEKRIYNTLERKGIVDSTSTLLLDGDPEIDKVKCPLFGKIITRSECLDLSGTTENVDHCSKCDIGKATKEKLLPEA